MIKNLLLTLGLLALTHTGLAASPSSVWIEGEDFTSPTELKSGEGQEKLMGGGKGYASEGWGNTNMMSEGKVLRANIEGPDVEKFVPAEGLVFLHDFDVPTAGAWEIWARIGYEFARSEFQWRVDDGAWATVKPSEPTIDVQPIQTWNELAWLKLASPDLKAGKHRIEFRHTPVQIEENGQKKTDRILHALDAVCLAQPGTFIPSGKWAPDADHRGEKGIAAESQVFKIDTQPGSDGRAWTPLNGLWQYAPWGETQFPIAEDSRLKPVEKLPDLAKLRWFAYRAPGAREDIMPEQEFTHRYLLRTRLDVPADAAGKGFFLDVQYSSLLVSVFVNGEFAGSTDTFHAPWQMDLSKFIRPGQTNDLVLAVKDAYYSLNPQNPNNKNETQDHRKFWNLPRQFLQANQGIAGRHDYPVAYDCRSGIIEPASIVVTGPVYATDVFAKPAEGKLGLEVSLLNPTDKPVELEVLNEVVPWNQGKGGPAECTFAPQKVSLPAGGNQTLTLEQPWANPTRWWPDAPHLYWVKTTLKSGGKTVDEKFTRFGFRTIDWSTDQFKINGVKWPMWADLSSFSRDPREQTRMARERSNANQTRYWQPGGTSAMTRREAMNHFDETGLLVRSSGTFDGQLANYGIGLVETGPDGKRVPRRNLWDGWRKQSAAWIKAERNHPSIYIWSLENEITYINVNNLGMAQECEPEIARGVREAMALDPTRPAMVDGGNCLRDESLPVNGAHYTEFMNAEFRDFPDAAYTREHYYDRARPQRGAWRMVPDRPIMGGEIYFANGYSSELFATIGGDRCFIGMGETMAARDLWAKMLTEGYRWCGYSSFHLWLGESETRYWNSWKPVAVFCRQWNWTWGSDSKVTRSLKVFNNTSNPAPIEAEWEFLLDGKKVAGEKRTFNIPCGEAEEFQASIAVPKLSAPASGEFILRASRGGQEVFSDTKPVRVLAAAALPNPKIKPGQLAVFDPQNKISPFLTKRGIPFSPAKGPEAVPASASIVLVGPDAISADLSTDPRWLALAANGKRVIVLDQDFPLAYRALPGDLEPSKYVGRFGFSEDLTHPIFRGLTQADFFTWGDDHILYRNVYKKGTRGGRSLFQCDDKLSHTALFESRINDGLLLLCQLDLGKKITGEAVAQQVFLNMLDYASAFRPVRKQTTAVIPAGDPRLALLGRIGLDFKSSASPLEALQGDGVAVVAATPENLKALADKLAEVDAFQKRGGWLMLWGLTPEGLADFNRLVRHDHVLRPFETERVLLKYPQDPLASGITLRDVVLDTGKNLYPWMALKAPDKDGFGWLVDHTDIAPFCKFPDGLAMGKASAHPGGDHEPRNLVNGFTSDDNWVFTYTIILDDGHKTRIPLELPKEEEITALKIRPSRNYHPVTKVNIYFDEDPVPVTAEIPFRDQPVVEDIPIAGRKAKKITLEVAGWGERGDRNIVVIDNIWLQVKRPDDYMQRVSSLLNVGALMAYRQGDGGIFLNQINLPPTEVNPENADKKATIVKTILANLGAVFKGGRTEVAAGNYRYQPVKIDDSRFNTYKHQNGQPQWFAKGDIAAIPVGARKFAGVDFLLSDLTTSPVPSVFTLAGAGSNSNDHQINDIAVNAKADVVCFLHACHAGPDVANWQRQVAEALENKKSPPPAPEVATYQINYEDGSKEEIKLLLNIHTGIWNNPKPAPLPEADLAWSGKQADGNPASAWVLKWPNPHPEKPIKSIDFRRSGQINLGAPALFGISTGLKTD